jgi:hypothetical protein
MHPTTLGALTLSLSGPYSVLGENFYWQVAQCSYERRLTWSTPLLMPVRSTPFELSLLVNMHGGRRSNHRNLFARQRRGLLIGRRDVRVLRMVLSTHMLVIGGIVPYELLP